MMLNKTVLKELARSLREANDTSKEEMEDSSLDVQIDKFFIDYEGEAKTVKKESFDVRSATRRLLEAEGAEETPGQEKNVAVEKDFDIDADGFAASVVRLITNFDSLVDVQNTLVKRAYNYLLKKHDLATAKNFLDILRRNFEIDVGKTQYDLEDEIEPPPAQRSGGVGGG